MKSRYKGDEDCAVESLVAHLREGDGTKVVIMECRAVDQPQEIFADALKKLGKKPFFSSDAAFKESIWKSLRAAVRDVPHPDNWTAFSGGFNTLVMEQIRSHGYEAFGFFMCDTWPKSQWEELHQFLRRCIGQKAPLAVVLATEKPAYEVSKQLRGLRIALCPMRVPFLDAADVLKLLKTHAPSLGPAQLDNSVLDLVLHVSNKSVQGVIHLASQLNKQSYLSPEAILKQLEHQLPSSAGLDHRRESQY